MTSISLDDKGERESGTGWVTLEKTGFGPGSTEILWIRKSKKREGPEQWVGSTPFPLGFGTWRGDSKCVQERGISGVRCLYRNSGALGDLPTSHEKRTDTGTTK